jgi:hypothetical protein
MFRAGSELSNAGVNGVNYEAQYWNRHPALAVPIS